MTTERHFGPEIIETDLGGVVVRDRPAATAILVGTFPVHEVHAAAEDQANYTAKKSTLIRRRSEIATHFGPYAEGFTIPQALDAIFDQDNGDGVGTIEVVNVFDPAVHVDGGSQPDPSQVTNLDILGAFDASGNASGLKMAYGTFQRFGWFPKFVAAPGFDGLVGVRAELDVINDKINARSYIDAPAGVTVQQCIAARGPSGDFDMQTDSERLMPCYPHMIVVDTANAGEARAEWFSARMLGIHLASIMTHGYHHSPSNRPVKGIEGSAQPIIYTPGQSDDDMQLLRAAGYITAVERWGEGVHSAGTSNAAFPNSIKLTTQIHMRFVADMLHEGILFFLDRYKDRLSSPARLNEVQRTINEWGLSKGVGAEPVLVPGGFKFWFDKVGTSVEEYADGKVEFQLRFMPVGILEWMQVHSQIDVDLAANPLGLASSSDPLFTTVEA